MDMRTILPLVTALVTASTQASRETFFFSLFFGILKTKHLYSLFKKLTMCCTGEKKSGIIKEDICCSNF